jgi:hypothetical protein
MGASDYETRVGTNPAAEATRYTALSLDGIHPKIDAYSDLSLSEKETLKSILNSLSGLVDQKEVTKLLSLVRNDEGKVLYKVLQRYSAVASPMTTSSTGVYTPLDSVIESSGKKIEIFVPENLETYADSGLIQDLLRYASHLPGVVLTRIKGEISIPNEDKANFFFMGYITELLSTQKMERISYNRDSTYQIGRHCARTKSLLMVLDQKRIPTKYLRVPERFLGGTTQFKEPELTRTLRTLVAQTSLEKIESLLHNLTAFSVRSNVEMVRAKIGENLFLPSSEFVHSLKRRVTRTIVTAGRKKGISSTTTVDATKPSQLATVGNWERDAIIELFEKPWESEQKLLHEFNKTRGVERNYSEFATRLSQILDLQWSCKQQVLRRTRHRIELYPEDRDAAQWKKLNWMRKILSEFTTLDRIPANLLTEFNPYPLIGVEKITLPDGFTHTISGLYQAKKLNAIHPSCDVLLRSWDNLITNQSAKADR